MRRDEDTAVRFSGVCKSYPSYHRITGGIKHTLFHPLDACKGLRRRRSALEGVSFSIRRGECFGLIGRNGAGKSTALGLIAGVLFPDQGSVQVNGRVSPLLELGAGFHPELTGRENIMLNGVLMGLTRREVSALEKEVVAFSELGELIDQPVRTYSSGMYAKLGFSVVTVLKPEILLIDEVLAVGDLAFQRKCEAVFEKFRSDPDVTIILVSHSLETVAKICDRAVWIEDKKVKMEGGAGEVTRAYKEQYAPEEREPQATKHNAASLRRGGGRPDQGVVRVAARNITPRDAVGNFAVDLAEFYRRHGIPARLYAHAPHPEMTGMVAPYSALDAEVNPEDILFHHFSIEDELLPHILTLPWKRKILYYHNVTPGHWFREYNPVFAATLERARGQFPLFAAFDAVLANSHFSLKEILPHIRPDAFRDVHPPTLDPERLTRLAPEPLLLPEAAMRILWVGRFAPHKRPELALDMLERLTGLGLDAALVMVGGGRRDFPEYAACVERRIAALPEGARAKFALLENLREEQLAWLYKTSSALLCTSGHEGYCLPLAEAMSFGLPVAALAQEAVEETLGGYAGILTEDLDAVARRMAGTLTIQRAYTRLRLTRDAQASNELFAGLVRPLSTCATLPEAGKQ